MSNVLDVLADLHESGVRFQTVSKTTWHIASASEAKLLKSLSVVFSVETACTSQHILEGFDKAGIDVDNVISIQRKLFQLPGGENTRARSA